MFRNIFGGASNNEGMGLLSWCLDWNLIGSDCLFNPIWLQINQDIGIFLTYILMAAVYYGNLWRAKDFPFMSQAVFVSHILACKMHHADALGIGCRWFSIQPDCPADERQVRPCQV